MIKGVIFDLDGVLVSTDELHFKAWKMLADRLGINDYTKEDNEKQKGVSRLESLEIVLSKGKEFYSKEEKEILAEEKNKYYVDLLQTIDSKVILSDVIPTLIMLKKRGIKIAVGSVSKNAPLILEKVGLTKYIDEVSCGLDITKSKPDPEVFLIAAKKLNVAKEKCLVVEDSRAGIIAAKAGGMLSLAVGPENERLEADYNSFTMMSNVNWNEILK